MSHQATAYEAIYINIFEQFRKIECQNTTHYSLLCLNSFSDDKHELHSSAPLYSCLQPIDIAQHVADSSEDSIYSISPAQGNKPIKAMDTEIDCFASKFVDGRNSFSEKRHIPVGIGRYINQRLFNVDNTFAEDPVYIFWAQYVKEINELSNCMSVAMRKATSSFGNKPITSDMLVDQDQINKLFRADDGFKFMKTVRGTPAYWEQTMRDLFSMIRQLGIPTFFTSFSAADRRWTEIVKCICNQLGHDYNEDMNWTDYCQLINKNVVSATRMFDHRVKCFFVRLLDEPSQSNREDH